MARDKVRRESGRSEESAHCKVYWIRWGCGGCAPAFLYEKSFPPFQRGEVSAQPTDGGTTILQETRCGGKRQTLFIMRNTSDTMRSCPAARCAIRRSPRSPRRGARCRCSPAGPTWRSDGWTASRRCRSRLRQSPTAPPDSTSGYLRNPLPPPYRGCA